MLEDYLSRYQTCEFPKTLWYTSDLVELDCGCAEPVSIKGEVLRSVFPIIHTATGIDDALSCAPADSKVIGTGTLILTSKGTFLTASHLLIEDSLDEWVLTGRIGAVVLGRSSPCLNRIVYAKRTLRRDLCVGALHSRDSVGTPVVPKWGLQVWPHEAAPPLDGRYLLVGYSDTQYIDDANGDRCIDLNPCVLVGTGILAIDSQTLLSAVHADILVDPPLLVIGANVRRGMSGGPLILLPSENSLEPFLVGVCIGMQGDDPEERLCYISPITLGMLQFKGKIPVA